MPADQPLFQPAGRVCPSQASVSAGLPDHGVGERAHDGLVASLAARSVQRGVRPGGAAAIRRALPPSPARAGPAPSSSAPGG